METTYPSLWKLYIIRLMVAGTILLLVYRCYVQLHFPYIFKSWLKHYGILTLVMRFTWIFGYWSSISLLDEMWIYPYIIILVLMRHFLWLLTPSYVSIFNIIVLGVSETLLTTFNTPFCYIYHSKTFNYFITYLNSFHVFW